MALTDVAVRQAKPRERPYKLRDVGGLHLLVHPGGGKYWRFDYRFGGKRKTIAVGVYLPAGASESTKPTMTLKAAGIRAGEIRADLDRKVDPMLKRKGEAAAEALAAERAQAALREHRQAERSRKAAQAHQRASDRATVRRVADTWVQASEAGWTVDHAHQVRQSLDDHVHPSIGGRPIAEVGTDDVLAVLTALLDAGKVETATRVFQRMSAVWEWAILRKHTSADPVKPLAREFGRLKKLARKRNPRRNFAAVDRPELPALLRAMGAYGGDTVTKLALRLLSLTFVRTGELRLAEWPEFDLDGAEPTWTIPAARMKVKLRGDRPAEPHIVPLSRQAVAALRELKRVSAFGSLAFPQSRKRDKPLSENALLYALGGMGYAGRMTGHGFRSVASTLLHEAGWPHDAIEAQLAHEKVDTVSAAYDRGKRLQVRREMVQAYADMLDQLKKEDLPAEVVPLPLAA